MSEPAKPRDRSHLSDPVALQVYLREALGGELPGVQAQRRMSPRPRHGWRPGAIPEGLRQAAALVLLYPSDDRPHLLLTQRNEDLDAHAGQVSLPGGELEGDESLTEAALREAREEVSLDTDRVAILGPLSPLHIPASGFVLHPFVGSAPRVGPLIPSDAEVARILEVPLELLTGTGALRVETWQLHDTATEVPFFRVDGLPLWGATAMVVAELLWVLGAAPDPWGEQSGAGSESDTLTEPGDEVLDPDSRG